METLKDTCVRLEHFETPIWAVESILDCEEVSGLVLDPCCGTGVLAEAAHRRGHRTLAIDIHHWGYAAQEEKRDFLAMDKVNRAGDLTILMNPPFSKATQFVEKALELGALKIICFQRFAWWESKARKAFWERTPPCRVYICGERANCWRHDIPHDERGSSSPTAHAWFVWEKNARGKTELGHIWKVAQQNRGE